MRTVEELSRALAEQQRHAPDGSGLVDAVMAQAKIRLRRRRVATLIASCTAIVAAVAPITILAPASMPPSLVETPPPSATPSPLATAAPQYRKPLQFTLGIAPDSVFFAASYAMLGTTQHLRVLIRLDGRQGFAGDVTAHDPDTFADVQEFQAGEVIAIPGRDHPVYYLSAYQQQGSAIGWRDPASGVWIVISQADSNDILRRMAADVRLTPLRDFVAAVHFGYLPPGLNPVSATGSDNPEINHVVMGFDYRQPASTDDPFSPMRTSAVQVGIYRGDDYLNHHFDELGVPGRLGALDVQYLDEDAGGYNVVDGGSSIHVRSANCFAIIDILDRRRIPREEQVRLAAGLQFANCNQRSTWVKPLD